MTSSPCQLLIDYLPGEWRAALVQNDKLVKLLIHRPFDRVSTHAQKGDIYYARLKKINKPLSAAFVDLGETRDGFLPLKENELHISEGTACLVQVRKAALNEKGALLSLHPELSGKDIILTPTRHGVNVSNKLPDRKEIKKALEDALPLNTGLVVRSSAIVQETADLIKQAQALIKQYQGIKNSAEKPIQKLYNAHSFTKDIEELQNHYDIIDVIFESPELLQQLPENLSPTIWSKPSSLFQHYNLDEQISHLSEKIVALPGGGNLKIERTRAFIAVDIDWAERHTGKKSVSEILALNMEALDVLKDQISLRNLCGQIVIDFLKLDKPVLRKELETRFKDMFEEDETVVVHGLSRMGLGEMVRQHQGAQLDEITTDLASNYYNMCRQIKCERPSSSLAISTALWDRKEGPGLKETRIWLEERLGLKPLFIQED